jgi:hypothetical protein
MDSFQIVLGRSWAPVGGAERHSLIPFLCAVFPRLMLPRHASSRFADWSCAVGLLDHLIAANA